LIASFGCNDLQRACGLHRPPRFSKGNRTVPPPSGGIGDPAVPCSIALVIDSDDFRRRRLHAAALSLGCEVAELAAFAEAVSVARRLHPALVVVGCNAVDDEGAAVLAELRELERRLPIIVVVRLGSEASAVAALRAGVKDYFHEPFVDAALADAMRRCLTVAGARASRGTGGARPDHPPSQALIGSSAAMQAVREQLRRVAASDATVLITGETGTGKELAARALHGGSGRPGRLVPVNCAAIPEGLLESELFGYESGAFTGATRPREGLLQLAHRGTVFLDEIGEMGAVAQAKVLRAIETREVYRLGGKQPVPLDVRIVAATNTDLEEAIEQGRFRRDLYFRLNVARVHLPALRQRRADIPAILDHYLQELNARARRPVVGFAPQTLEALAAYDWPGNVRELKNLVESVFVTPPAQPIALEDLPSIFRDRLARYCTLPDAERTRLMEALLAANWNKSRAAEILQWSRMTLYRKMAKYSVVTSAPPARLHTRRR
jgi:DNA-binding NtrC family response regulator